MIVTIRPQTEINADLFDPLPTLAHKFAGTPTKYAPPRCINHQDNCVCHHNHKPSGADVDETLKYYGMKRRRDGSAWIVSDKPMRPNAKPAAIPLTTRQNVAACAALGLSFWSDAPEPATLWAVDDKQHAHLVKISRSKGTVEHWCMTSLCGYADHVEDIRGWTVADAQLELVSA